MTAVERPRTRRYNASSPRSQIDMTRAGLLPGFLLLLVGGTALAFGGLDPSPGPTADSAATAPPAYTSHYLVFGTRTVLFNSLTRSSRRPSSW